MTERDESRDRPGDEMVRLTVAEAAHRLGISEAGVRKRIKRGQLPYERGDDRRVWVWVSPGEARHAEDRDTADWSRDRDKASRDVQLEDLRVQVRHLREQLDRADERDRENRRIIAALTSRIPELPAPEQPSPPSEPRESPETAEEKYERVVERERTRELQRQLTDMREQLEEERSKGFWRRVFGS